MTDWFWAGPFVWLLYFAVPGSWKVKAPVSLLAFGLMYGISNYKSTWSIVYPVIGQEVVFSEDTLIQSSKYGPPVALEEYYSRLEREGKTINRNYILNGSVFKVVRLTGECGGMIGTDHCVILSDGKRELTVEGREIIMGEVWYANSANESFCSKVEWEYCLHPTSLVSQPFRGLSGLMNYPLIPFLLYESVRNNF